MAEQNGKGPVAALFDVDGTLVDTNYLHAVTWWEAFTQAGYQVPMARNGARRPCPGARRTGSGRRRAPMDLMEEP
jgi:beta-phosphoglucomutase-like phosphatase (HAD superfamily)